eukprot:12264732-Ditylum_brightwellii.AAC.1
MKHTAIWKLYADNNFPMYGGIKKKTPLIILNAKKQNATLKWIDTRKTKLKHDPWIMLTLTESGWCDIFLHQDQRRQSVSWLRNSLQDAVLNACIQLNVPLKKEKLYEEV